MTKELSGREEIAYGAVLSDIVSLLESARRASARAVNTIITTTYWEVGRRIVDLEQEGSERAEYGKHVIERLSRDLSDRFGRGFSQRNLETMRRFYLAYRDEGKPQTVSAESRFALPWSHYVRLIGIANPEKRRFYEAEAVRGGWSVRQLTARSIPSSTREPPFPETKLRC